MGSSCLFRRTSGRPLEDVDDCLKYNHRLNMHNLWDDTMKLANVIFFIHWTALQGAAWVATGGQAALLPIGKKPPLVDSSIHAVQISGKTYQRLVDTGARELSRPMSCIGACARRLLKKINYTGWATVTWLNRSALVQLLYALENILTFYSLWGFNIVWWSLFLVGHFVNPQSINVLRK